jgi:hypothetical protein
MVNNAANVLPATYSGVSDDKRNTTGEHNKSHRQTICRSYPVTDFSNGITNLTKISAAQHLGLVFLFVILAQYDRGWDILCTALSKKNKAQLDQVIHVFEGMLCFDRWLNQPTYCRHTSHD